MVIVLMVMIVEVKMSNRDDQLSCYNIQIPAVYKECFMDNYRYFILSSGRVSGKTSLLVALWWMTINKYPDRDIVVLQATAAEIKDSIINEIKKFISASDLDAEFDIPKSSNIITRKDFKGKTYFYPITDSKGGQRSRGINTENKLSLVMYEECQKNKDANVVEQSVVTFIRQLDKDAKLVIVGNNETAGHWFVDYVEKKKKEDGWCYIYANCYDIWGLLNQQTRDYIESLRQNNNTEFRRVFLGDIHANTSDVVFPQFTREENYKTVEQIPRHYIVHLIVGIDHATANDTFAVVPVAVLDNGETQTLQVCFDDPEVSGVALAPTEQCQLLEEFMDYLDEKYGFGDNYVPVTMSVDGAAAPFIAQLRHTKKTARNKKLWARIRVMGFTKKKKDVNLGIIKNAFAYKVLTILNEGKEDWQGHKNPHRLVREIEAQRYLPNHKLNPKIKNDLCDALEYGLIPYYTNCYNLSFPVRMQKEDREKFTNITRFANMENKKIMNRSEK